MERKPVVRITDRRLGLRQNFRRIWGHCVNLRLLVRGEGKVTFGSVIALFLILSLGTGFQLTTLAVAVYTPFMSWKVAALAVYALVLFIMGKLFLPGLLHKK